MTQPEFTEEELRLLVDRTRDVREAEDGRDGRGGPAGHG